MSSLAKIQIGKKQLGLADEDYRDLLERVTGQRSSASLSEPQRVAVIAAMQELGFVTARKTRGLKPHQEKCAALWGALSRAGKIEDGSLAALSAFVRRQAGVQRIEWLTAGQAPKVIEALKAMLARGSK
jgi:phage gp16-like protein